MIASKSVLFSGHGNVSLSCTLGILGIGVGYRVLGQVKREGRSEFEFEFEFVRGRRETRSR